MNVAVKIKDIETVNEFKDYWSNEDLVNLLKLFGYNEADSLGAGEVREMLYLAISDYETNEAAEIVLTYKLADALSEGQIQQISNDMTGDKVAEEYPEIALHAALFNVNQLLFKAYNGKFPNTKATVLDFELTCDDAKEEITKEVVLKALQPALRPQNLIIRLFEEPLQGTLAFDDAEHILWSLESKGNNQYTLTTSDYWLNKEDITESEFSSTIVMFEEEEEEA